MALRSRIQTIRAPNPDVDEPDTPTEVEQEATQDEAPPERIYNRGGVREPAAELVETTGPSASDEADAPAPVVKTRKSRGPNKVSPTDRKKHAGQEMPVPAETAPQLRSQIKDLETDLKALRARHTDELKAFRVTYQALHAKLFDLTK